LRFDTSAEAVIAAHAPHEHCAKTERLTQAVASRPRDERARALNTRQHEFIAIALKSARSGQATSFSDRVYPQVRRDQ
jgi:hypothetical protein